MKLIEVGLIYQKPPELDDSDSGGVNVVNERIKVNHLEATKYEIDQVEWTELQYVHQN